MPDLSLNDHIGLTYRSTTGSFPDKDPGIATSQNPANASHHARRPLMHALPRSWRVHWLQTRCETAGAPGDVHTRAPSPSHLPSPQQQPQRRGVAHAARPEGGVGSRCTCVDCSNSLSTIHSLLVGHDFSPLPSTRHSLTLPCLSFAVSYRR